MGGEALKRESSIRLSCILPAITLVGPGEDTVGRVVPASSRRTTPRMHRPFWVTSRGVSGSLG